VPALFYSPFWLDPSDLHRVAAGTQISSRPLAQNFAIASGDWPHDRVIYEEVWAEAISRWSPKGSVPSRWGDEGIARIKQILCE
jgi:hypothetical protein